MACIGYTPRTGNQEYPFDLPLKPKETKGNQGSQGTDNQIQEKNSDGVSHLGPKDAVSRKSA